VRDVRVARGRAAERVSSAAAVIHQGSSGCGASNCAQC